VKQGQVKPESPYTIYLADLRLGNVVEAVRHCRTIISEIRRASAMGEEELFAYAKEIGAPYHLLKETARLKKLPVVNFAAGGVATPGERS
jgi:pyridoxal 5'-phosphate synthase pdxS subunit